MPKICIPKTLLKEMKEDLSKWRDTQYSWVRRQDDSTTQMELQIQFLSKS